MHAKLVDGFTFTMPDTPENQAEYPHSSSQKPGVGLPIARCLGILSLATAAVLDVAIGPYSGKETGETALLRTRLDSFSPGDLLVADRYFCSFFLVAMLLGRGVQSCTRMHQRRHFDFRRGHRLGTRDHLVVWTKPQSPQWMDPATYETIPELMTLRELLMTLRELQFPVIKPGYRTQQITIVTTLTDTEVYSKADIAELYGFRCNAELDIRAIKQNLNLNHVRCKSPQATQRYNGSYNNDSFFPLREHTSLQLVQEQLRGFVVRISKRMLYFDQFEGPVPVYGVVLGQVRR
ncbi:MAG: IS4 family transposase [Planctomycetia bacterium]|nr:IS4 family transposase [Planctomycetia bacterium]